MKKSPYSVHPGVLMTQKWIVPLYRKHVFAQIKPTTQTRVVGQFKKDVSRKGAKTQSKTNKSAPRLRLCAFAPLPLRLCLCAFALRLCLCAFAPLRETLTQTDPLPQTRIDMGFAPGDMKPKGRLFISTTKVKHWLKVAYDRDA